MTSACERLCLLQGGCVATVGPLWGRSGASKGWLWGGCVHSYGKYQTQNGPEDDSPTCLGSRLV